MKKSKLFQYLEDNHPKETWKDYSILEWNTAKYAVQVDWGSGYCFHPCKDGEEREHVDEWLLSGNDSDRRHDLSFFTEDGEEYTPVANNVKLTYTLYLDKV